MKKICIVPLLLVLLVSKSAISQEQQKVVYVKELTVGDKVPDIEIGNVLNARATTVQLSAFKGKLLIVDFWATWCRPCVAMLPRLDSLQKEFGGKVHFLSVTTQQADAVQPFMARFNRQYGYKPSTVVSDRILSSFFPHMTLPHCVWINGESEVIAITGYDKVTPENIRKIIEGKERPDWTQKKESRIAFDKNNPLLIGGNGGDGGTLIYHSLLTGYIDGLLAEYNGYRADSTKGRKLSARNVNLYWLYSIAYGEDKYYFGANKMIYEVKDKSRLTNEKVGEEYVQWLKNGNGYCYEVIVPPSMIGQEFAIMQQDLSRYFPYVAKVEKRRVKCLVFTRTSSIDKLKTKGGPPLSEFSGLGCSLRNSYLSQFYGRLSVLYLQKLPLPLVNETGYLDKVDMEIRANLSDVESLNKELEKYDLKLLEAEREIDMLVIRDKTY